jgi:hypothetical protein
MTIKGLWGGVVGDCPVGRVALGTVAAGRLVTSRSPSASASASLSESMSATLPESTSASTSATSRNRIKTKTKNTASSKTSKVKPDISAFKIAASADPSGDQIKHMLTSAFPVKRDLGHHPLGNFTQTND